MNKKIILIFILLSTTKVFGAGDDWTGMKLTCPAGGGQTYSFNSSSEFKRITFLEKKHRVHMHSGTYKPYKDGRHMLIEFNSKLIIYKGIGMDYDDEGKIWSVSTGDLYFDRQTLRMKVSTPEGGPSTPVFKCEVIEEGNLKNITQQFINKQKKYFVIDPQKEIENNKKKNKL
jgi:hypothetical protein